MAEKKVKVKVDIETNAAGSIAQLKELKKQLREAAAGSAEFKKLANEIDDLEDKIKGAKQSSGDWVDQLASAPGPLGAIGGALNKAKVATVSFGAALKATGIGLVVAAIGGLVAAISQSEDATKKFQPILIGLQKIFNGVYRALEPVIDAVLNLATNAMPFVTKAFGVAYSAISSFLQGLGKLGSAIGKLIKGDFTGAWEDAKESVTGFGKRYEEANNAFVEGTKEVTKIEKEELDKRREQAEKDAQKRKEAEEKRKAAAEKARQEKEAKDKAAAEAELAAFKETLDERERQEYEAGEKAQERRAALLAAGKTDFTLIEEAYQKELADIKKKYDDQAAEEQKKKDEKAKADLLKKQEEERGILLTGLQAQFEALDKANKQSDLDFEQDLQRLAQQKDLLAQQEATELQNTELTEFQKTEIRKKYADARMAITDQEVATEKAAAQAKHEINMAYLGLFEQFGSLLQQIAGKNKGLAIAGIIIQQAAAIGQIIANTAIANAKSVAASPLTGGMPWVAINTISAGLSIAATIAGAVKSIQQINQAASQAGVKGGGSGAGAGGAAPQIAAPRVGGAAAPTINTTGGMNPTTQIAETIGRAQAPVRAYVVSGEVSSQQALDRRTSRAATFTGG